MLYSVQYLRGVAAFLVLLQHTATKGFQYSSDPLSGFKNGMVGVDIFFVVSGFIMAYTTADRTGLPGVMANFIKRRVIRILPLYWILTLVGLAALLIMPSKVNMTGGDTKILQSFLLFPSKGIFILQDGWTLSYEFLFYGIFSLGLLMKGKRGLILTLSILLGLILLGFLSESRNFWIQFVSSLELVNFMSGILLHELFVRWKRVPALMALLFFSLGIALFVIGNQEMSYIPRPITAFFLCAGLIFQEEQVQKRPLRFLSILGDSSYSLYLIHPFILAGTALVLSALGLTKGPWILPFIVILIASSILGGILCYRWLEKPIARNSTYAIFATT